MILRHVLRTGTALLGAVLLLVLIGQIGDLAFHVSYPEHPAYPLPEREEAPVDLAELQRSWPNGLSHARDQARLRGFIQNIADYIPPARVGAEPGGTRPPPEPEPELAVLLAEASADRGARAAQACTACHSLDQGGNHGVGPNLWGIVGREIASADGFNYSAAMADEPGAWTYAKLDAFLKKPSAAVPDNRMSFQGVRRATDRAAVLAYLQTLSSDPVPFPDPSTAVAGAP